MTLTHNQLLNSLSQNKSHISTFVNDDKSYLVRVLHVLIKFIFVVNSFKNV